MIEYKWLLASFAVVMSSIVFGDAVQTYTDKQCRIAAITAQVPADDVDKACGKKK